MSSELRKIYQQANLLHRYFDEKAPVDLFRGQRRVDAKQGLPVLHPNPGFVRKDGTVREPDVRIEERHGKKFVLGCRSIWGKYRGVSTFDKKNPGVGGMSWFRLPEGTDIPEPLAITQDDDFKDRPNHYTIAPKDDMPLELFLVWLNSLGSKMLEDV